MKGIFFIDAENETAGQHLLNDVFDADIWNALSSSLRLSAPLFSVKGMGDRRDELRETEVLFSTWGMPALAEEQITEYFPLLRAVFYAAGSVQGFARPFLKRGIRVFSAASANAIPVAEYAAAQVLLANKGFFQACRKMPTRYQAAKETAASHPGNYRIKVGILGAGAIGRLVIERLRSSDLQLFVFDPFLGEEEAARLGVQKTSLDFIFRECQTITNHLANNPQTAGMLDYTLFSRMKPNATFLNTGRGAQVVESDLIQALEEEPGRCTVLDVTDPEPPFAGHPFYQMDNVWLTPHIAGSMGKEIHRMGEFMWKAFQDYQNGKPNGCEITLPQLQTMA